MEYLTLFFAGIHPAYIVFVLPIAIVLACLCAAAWEALTSSED